MKTLLQLFSLAVILAMIVFSSILYMHENYGFSALLTVSWFASITLLIGTAGSLKEKSSVQ